MNGQPALPVQGGALAWANCQEPTKLGLRPEAAEGSMLMSVASVATEGLAETCNWAAIWGYDGV